MSGESVCEVIASDRWSTCRRHRVGADRLAHACGRGRSRVRKSTRQWRRSPGTRRARHAGVHRLCGSQLIGKPKQGETVVVAAAAARLARW